MSRHNTKRKPVPRAIARAASSLPAGGTFVYVPPQTNTASYIQTFYGNAGKQMPGQLPIYSPGDPLPAQPGASPYGKPIQYRYPPQFNVYQPDRSLGDPDIPSFEVLRRFATMYDGNTLCLRKWLDFVPKMKLKIGLKQEYVDAGAEEKQYQQELTYFRNFWDRPDGEHDTHTWLKMMLTEQLQIDELYLYKNRTRGRRMLGYQIVSGETMKPLLDEWGRTPTPRDAQPWAYQQYPWGIPGMGYTTEQMLHYRETPRANTPYGFSRIEAIILRINQALRKEKKDLAYFTEGNIPQSFMEVPEASTWSQQDIDAYEQAWNALLAGSAQQQVRMKFLQPGMKYIPADQYQLLTDFDKYLLNVCAIIHGFSLGSLGFIEDVNRSNGETLEAMEYRRTVEPVSGTYAQIMTSFMATDFPDDLHGEMFEATWSGYEEEDSIAELAGAYTGLVENGLIGLEEAADEMKIPRNPDAPRIGRVLVTKSGVMFLDDPEFMAAQKQAMMAGFQMATQPSPEQAQEQDEDEQLSSKQHPRNKPAKKTSGKPTQRSIEGFLRRVIEEWLVEDEDEPASLIRAESARPAMLQQHTGMMVAFMLKPEEAAQLALPDGEAPEDMHVTLAFLGDMFDETRPGKLHPVATLDTLKTLLSAYTKTAQPLEGRIGGLGHFSNPDQDSTPIIAPVNVPGLQDWRRRLVQIMETAGYYVANDYDFLPHVTLAYIPNDAPMPIERLPRPVYLTFDTLCLAIGDDRYYFPIGGTPDETNETGAQMAQARSLSTITASRATSSSAPGRDSAALRERNDGQALARSGGGSALATGREADARALSAEYRKWRNLALKYAEQGKPCRPFASSVIPEQEHKILSELLSCMDTPDGVRASFAFMERTKQEPRVSKMGACTCELCQSMAGKPIGEQAPPYHEGCSCESVPAPMERAAKQEVPESELIGGQPRLEYNAKLDIWEAADTEEQLAQLRSKGEYLLWEDHPSATGVCATCAPNVGKIVKNGERFPSGHRLPQVHRGCMCTVEPVQEPK